jgi:hypothetical protein
MYVCIMRQCFDVGTSYGSSLGLTIPAYGWDVTQNICEHMIFVTTQSI